jgi:hypothetical protein
MESNVPSLAAFGTLLEIHQEVTSMMEGGLLRHLITLSLKANSLSMMVSLFYSPNSGAKGQR